MKGNRRVNQEDKMKVSFPKENKNGKYLNKKRKRTEILEKNESKETLSETHETTLRNKMNSRNRLDNIKKYNFPQKEEKFIELNEETILKEKRNKNSNVSKKGNNRKRRNIKERSLRTNESVKDLIRRLDNQYQRKFDNLKKQIRSLSKKINSQNTKISLLSEINNQSEMHFKQINEYIMNIGADFNNLYNS